MKPLYILFFVMLFGSCSKDESQFIKENIYDQINKTKYRTIKKSNKDKKKRKYYKHHKQEIIKPLENIEKSKRKTLEIITFIGSLLIIPIIHQIITN